MNAVATAAPGTQFMLLLSPILTNTLLKWTLQLSLG